MDITLLEQQFYNLIVVIYFSILGFTIFRLIKDKGDPTKTLAWIMLIVWLPIVGLILFVAFGRNFRKRKIFTKKMFQTSSTHADIVENQLKEFSLDSPVFCNEVGNNRDLVTLLLNNSKSPITYNNYIEILNNGEATFDKIIEKLTQAERFIHIEYYIVKDDTIGNIIADILINKASDGVEVRFIYDDVGSWSLPKSYIKRLKDGGVKVANFMPVLFPLLTSRINNRNHRKIIVIDGSIGFTGGINIADKYIDGNDKIGAWRDTHLFIEGEATLSLHSVFANDWLFLTNERLSFEEHFKIEESIIFGDKGIQIAYSGPDSDWQTIMQIYFCAITRAENHIYISTPYFLPNGAILTGLKVAAMSGLDVRIMIPAKSDSRLVYLATCSYIQELLDAKVKVYMYNPGFNHSKIIMIDSTMCSIGTANMDIRSFESNFEVTALIYNREKTVELESIFLEDLANSTEITAEGWSSRKKRNNFKEGVARLFTPLL